MPRLKLPDGVELHWEARGEGPAAVLANQYLGYPEVFEGLLADLARDHRTIVYHLRGTGSSTREGPYDMATDVADLVAVVEEAGGPAVAIGMGDGCNRAVRAAAERPDLIGAVVTPGGNPLGRVAVEDTEGLASSDSVLEALVEQLRNDYRGALRSLISSVNPQMDEQAIRDRVERTVAHCPREVAVPRLEAWIGDAARDEALALGDRLWILQPPDNPWFPSREIAERTRKMLPEAHVEQAPDGAISRPDVTAGVVRGITAGAAAHPLMSSRPEPAGEAGRRSGGISVHQIASEIPRLRGR